MIDHLKEALEKIDERLLRSWIEELVLEKTFVGFKFQEAILKKVSTLTGKPYRSATVEEESKGIDGYIGELPVSIKPVSYKAKKGLMETINAKMIFYEKSKDGMTVDISNMVDLQQ